MSFSWIGFHRYPLFSPRLLVPSSLVLGRYTWRDCLHVRSGWALPLSALIFLFCWLLQARMADVSFEALALQLGINYLDIDVDSVHLPPGENVGIPRLFPLAIRFSVFWHLE